MVFKKPIFLLKRKKIKNIIEKIIKKDVKIEKNAKFELQYFFKFNK